VRIGICVFVNSDLRGAFVRPRSLHVVIESSNCVGPHSNAAARPAARLGPYRAKHDLLGWPRLIAGLLQVRELARTRHNAKDLCQGLIFCRRAWLDLCANPWTLAARSGDV
jgi:hypothetical protein